MARSSSSSPSKAPTWRASGKMAPIPPNPDTLVRSPLINQRATAVRPASNPATAPSPPPTSPRSPDIDDARADAEARSPTRGDQLSSIPASPRSPERPKPTIVIPGSTNSGYRAHDPKRGIFIPQRPAAEAGGPAPPPTITTGDQTGQRVPTEVSRDDEGAILIRWPLRPSPGQLRLSLTRRDLNQLRRSEWVSDQLIQFGIHYVLRDPNPFGIVASPDRPPPEDIRILDALFYRQLKDSLSQSKRTNMLTAPFIVMPLHLGVHWAVSIIVNADLILPPTPSEAANGRRGKVPIQIHEAQPPPTKKTRRATTLTQPRLQFRPYPPPGLDPRAMPLMSIEDFLPLPLPPKPSEGVPVSPEVYPFPPSPIPDFDPNRPTILNFDSAGPTQQSVTENIKEYLRTQALATFPRATLEAAGISMTDGANAKALSQLSSFNVIQVPTPQQKNGFDCGLFVLHYVESFFFNPVRATEICVNAYLSPSTRSQPSQYVHAIFRPTLSDSCRREWVALSKRLEREWLQHRAAHPEDDYDEESNADEDPGFEIKP